MVISVRSAAETMAFGRELSQKLKGGEIIALNGEMGSGKTTLTKGLAEGLGINEAVTSPTFAIMSVYEGTLTLCHYDAYRLSGADELYENGLDEYLGHPSCVCVIEWAERIKEALKGRDVTSISLKYTGETEREISVEQWQKGI